MDEGSRQDLDTETLLHMIEKGATPPAPVRDIEEFFSTQLQQRGMKKSDVIRLANIDKSYGYQIMKGEKTASQNYYLRIGLVMGLDLRTMQRMLAVAKSPGLHPIVERDAAVIYAIFNHFTWQQTHEYLENLGLAGLENEIE